MRPTMRPESTPILQVQDLTVRYDDVLAVDRASLESDGRTLTALVGPSGCGKTTLLRAIAGFEVPAEGRIDIDGRNVVGRKTWVPPERRSVGMVFQQGALFPHMSVADNVAFGIRGVPDERQRVARLLKLVDLSELRDRYPDQLSGGQQQRAALARALAPSPRLVLLDEPFANLDADLRHRMRDEVRAVLAQTATSALMVTHDQEEALGIADRVAVMCAGRILQVGTPEQVYGEPASAVVADFIGRGQLVCCRVDGGRVASGFGTTVCSASEGRARLLIRAEDVVLLPSGEPSGVPGTVERHRYYGHGRICEVRLEDGDMVRVRDSGSTDARPSQAVRLRLKPKRYRLFAADDTGLAIGHTDVVD